MTKRLKRLLNYTEVFKISNHPSKVNITSNYSNEVQKSPTTEMKTSSILVALATLSNSYTLPLMCAPSGTIMSTPTYGSTGAIFTVCSESTIAGPQPPIYNVLIDFNRYSAWNTFVYAVDLPSDVTSASDVYIDMPMTFHTSGLLPGVNSTSDERISYLELENDPSFVGWKFDPGAVGGLLMNAEHVSLLVDLGDGTTKYVSWETYYGALSALTAALKKNLQTEFEAQGRNLKVRVEALAA